MIRRSTVACEFSFCLEGALFRNTVVKESKCLLQSRYVK